MGSRRISRDHMAAAEEDLAQEAGRLRASLESMQGPPEPRRMIVPAEMEDLFQEATGSLAPGP